MQRNLDVSPRWYEIRIPLFRNFAKYLGSKSVGLSISVAKSEVKRRSKQSNDGVTKLKDPPSSDKITVQVPRMLQPEARR